MWPPTPPLLWQVLRRKRKSASSAILTPTGGRTPLATLIASPPSLLELLEDVGGYVNRRNSDSLALFVREQVWSTPLPNMATAPS